jgi:hypothetical protein
MAFSSTNKHDYIEVVNRGVPEFYRVTDYRTYGSEEDVSLTFLGKLLKAAIQNELLFEVSGRTKEQVAEYFVPDSRTYVTPNSFQGKILAIYGLTYDDFASKTEFKSWLTNTFLPDAVLNDPTGFYGELSSYGFGTYSSLELTHEYLLDSLGLFYMMNTSSLEGAAASSYASAIEVEYLADAVYDGKEATAQEALNALFRFFWENRENSTFYRGFLPEGYGLPNSELSANVHLSGTQLYEAIRAQLETWTDKRLKNHDFYKNSLTAVITNAGVFPTKLRDAGPFQRFLKALSLGVADINLILEEISDLLSIDDCPEQFLELLANNIGWQLLTGEHSRWRAQLRNAVLMYKSKGSVLGLEAACKLIFPDGIFTASSVLETWESYIPKLLYYMVKNKSFIAKEGLEFEPLTTTFKGNWPDGIRFNQASRNLPDAKDRNHRFLVDSILERFHNKFGGAIQIRGKSFTQLPIWTCLPEGQRGFFHRNYPNDPSNLEGFFVAVPPWEKYGFYTETEIDAERISFFCDVLSGSRYDGGFEVDEYIVEAFSNLANGAINSAYAASGTPVYAENNKFRLFTSDHVLPPDYLDYIEFGETDSLADFDVWNTKGSHLFATFNAESLDFVVNAYDTFRSKAALETYRDVLRTFVPLHAVVRVLLYLDLEDTYIPSGTLCVFQDACLDDFNTAWLGSRRTNFWAGASGTGDLSATYVNGDGRILPSYDSASSTFWQASATDLDRNASRRRNYRYTLDCYPYMRGGKSMPIALTYYDGSSSNPYLNSDEYIVKGFEYDRQAFEAPSSVVWDNSGFYSSTGCESEKISGDFSLSTLYPFRSASEEDFQCSSLPVYRDTLKGVMEVMTNRTLQGDRFFDFTDASYRGFEFGTTLHESYSIYKNEFSGSLENNQSPNQPYYGGHNFLSYAFGPTIWNSDFQYKGSIAQFSEIITAASSLYPTYTPGGPTKQPVQGQRKNVEVYGNWEYMLVGAPTTAVMYDGDQGAGTPIVFSGSLVYGVLVRPRNSDMNFGVASQWTPLGYNTDEICNLFHGNTGCTGGNCSWSVEGADNVFTNGVTGQSQTGVGFEVSSYDRSRDVRVSITSHDGSSLTLTNILTLSGDSTRSDSRYGYDSQWRKVVGGNKSQGQPYQNSKGEKNSVASRTYFVDAPSGITYGSRLVTREFLSGIEIHQPRRNCKSFIVVNSLDVTEDSTLRGNALTLFNTDGVPLEVVVPFDPATQGTQTYNMLRPQSQFYVDVFAKTQNGNFDQQIGISLVTSGVTQDAGSKREWSFHWPSKKWIPTDMVTNTDDLIKKLTVRASEQCVAPYRVDFHTQDIHTIKEIPCVSAFMSSSVHTSSTGYQIRVTNQSTVPSDQDGLNIYEISVVDKCLNYNMNNFNASEVDRIYTFWDTLSDGKYSREAADSSGYFETSGGSRAEYLELVGYTDYTTSSQVFVGKVGYDIVEIQVGD